MNELRVQDFALRQCVAEGSPTASHIVKCDFPRHCTEFMCQCLARAKQDEDVAKYANQFVVLRGDQSHELSERLQREGRQSGTIEMDRASLLLTC